MIESPLIQEMMAKTAAETRHKDILFLLAASFGPIPEEVEAAVRTVYEEAKLDELLRAAASCPDLKAFRASLTK